MTEGYWQQLAQDLHEMAPLRGHQRDFLQVICNGLIRGGLRIYEVPAPDHHRIADRDTVIQSRRGEQYQFVPASYALTRSHKPYHFHSPAEVHELLHDLAPNLEQLVALASALKLAPSPHSVSYTQLLDLLADALADEALVLHPALRAPLRRRGIGGCSGADRGNTHTIFARRRCSVCGDSGLYL